MSLDITLIQKRISHVCSNCRHITYENEDVHWQNITHNLSKMAKEAGFGDQLWGRDETIKLAKDLIKPIEDGIKELKDNPNIYKQFSAPNSWGTFEQFIPWLEVLLIRLKEYPNAQLHFSV